MCHYWSDSIEGKRLGILGILRKCVFKGLAKNYKNFLGSSTNSACKVHQRKNTKSARFTYKALKLLRNS